MRTDSKTLSWLKNQKDTRAKLTRWHLLPSEFSFEIEHVSGKDNEPVQVRTVRVARIQPQPPTYSMLVVDSGDDDQSRSHLDVAEQAHSHYAEVDQLPVPTVPEEEDDMGNARRRYNLRARDPVDYRDNRAYDPGKRRNYF